VSPHSPFTALLQTHRDFAALCLLAPSFWSRYATEIELLLLGLLLTFLVVLQNESRRRKRTQDSLASRYALERHISAFSERLAASRPEQLDLEIETGLRKLLALGGGKHVSWYVKAEGSDSFDRKYFVGRHNAKPSPLSITTEDMPWAMERLVRHEGVVVANLKDFRASAQRERRFFEAFSAKSVALVPANQGTFAKGLLAIASGSGGRRWVADSVSQLKVLGNLIAAATQRTNAQRAQTESEVRFDHLFEQAPIGIALESLDGQLLHANPALCAMLGYRESELVRLSCGEFSHPEDLRAEKHLFKELCEGRRSSYQLQKRFLRSDGSFMWGDVSVSLLMGTGEQAPPVIGMVRDITVSKTAEERLRASETRLQSTLDVLSAAVAILDETGTIIAVNADWRKFVAEGETRFRDFALGSNFFDLSAAATGGDAESMQDVAQRAELLLRGELPGDPLLQRSQSESGVEVWYQIMMARFEENGSPRVALSYRDVTELIRAREELAQNEERLSMTLDASNTGTWEWDIANGRVRWRGNKTLSTGEREKEFQGDYRQFLNFVHPEDRKKIEDSTEQALQGGDSFSAEFRIDNGKGALRWILGKGKIIRDPKGHAIRMLGVNVDITELKERDLKLQELASRLIQAQDDERRRISRELHDDIGQRVSLLANELESLSHETRSNEQSRSGAIENLRQQADELATDIHELSHELHSSKLQHLGLRAALKELCEKLSENRQIQVALHTDWIDAALPPDVALCLYRVAQEALNNVIKHSHAQNVTLETARTGRTFRLVVRDSGVGFDPTVVSPGIGLVGMRERLRTIGGELQVKSSPGTGTEVLAEVKVREQAASANA
jgi:PAS domain S-box-containing protein